MNAMQTSGKDKREVYQIRILGHLDESWSGWFGGFQITFEGDATSMVGPVVDQVALRSILEKLWDLNLTIISVSRIAT